MGDTKKDSPDCSKMGLLFGVFILFAGFFSSIVYLDNQQKTPDPVPNIEIASMEFTVRNITQTRLSANWDLLVRIPRTLPNDYICLQGDIQASLLYKDITLVTSSRQRYSDLKYDSPQQLRVSTTISHEEDIGLLGKHIMKDIKEKRQVKFGSQLFLTDCREKTTGVLRYVCDETTLWFEPDSETEAGTVGDNPTCTSFD